MGGVACVEAACVLLNASRFYVRQVAFGEAMRWNELAPCDEDGDEQAAQRLGRVSTFGITLRACSVLVSEFPATNAAYLLCALLNAAQSPLVSLLVSRTVSAPPEQVDAVRAIYREYSRSDAQDLASMLTVRLREVTDEFLIYENRNRPDILEQRQ